MKKTLTVILIIALTLVVGGGVIILVGLGLSGWSCQGLSNVTVEERNFTESADAPLDSVSIDFDNAKVSVLFDAEAESVSVDYPLLFNKNGKALNEVKIDQTSGRVHIAEKTFWYANIGLINFTTPEVRVTLPQSRVYGISIKTNNGQIVMEGNGSATSIVLKTKNGQIDTTGAVLACQNDVRLDTNNGRIVLGSFSAANLYAETDNGEIRFSDGVATSKIEASTDNGRLSVVGTLTAQTIGFELDNGEIAAKEGLLRADNVFLETDVGAINARIGGNESDYTITVEQDLGNSNVVSQSGGSKRLTVSCDIGDIDILFDGIVAY